MAAQPENAGRRTGKVRWILTIIGAIAFVAGFLLSVIAGIWYPANVNLAAALVILGLVVGLLNITARESLPYLVAATALVLVGYIGAFGPLNAIGDNWGVLKGLGDTINNILRMVMFFTAPAAVVNAIKVAQSIARPGD
ncbi:MAG: hypothetical protein EXR55_02135 [Dehalococcoidia bacterium]|nr:hypothetical protein [Dehalococcoidia bacterium]